MCGHSSQKLCGKVGKIAQHDIPRKKITRKKASYGYGVNKSQQRQSKKVS
jgi:hypothetical protein